MRAHRESMKRAGEAVRSRREGGRGQIAPGPQRERGHITSNA